MPKYKLPNGAETEDQQLYLKLWQELGAVVEALVPEAKLASFDPNLSFDVSGREGQLTLDVWFVQVLAANARPMNGRKFKLSAVRTQNCETCGVPVHTSGAGRTRRFCPECIVVRAKLRAAKEVES